MSDPRFMAARHAAHHAAQPVSAWGATHLTAGDVHENANLAWNVEHQALVGRTAHGVAAALGVSPLRWMLLRGSDVLAERAVVGQTLAQGLTWFAAEGTAAGAPDRALEPVDYELPPHPVVDGAPFPGVDAAAAATLAGWFDTAHHAISEIQAGEPHASPVRCWPHHFDLATLISLDPHVEDAEEARSVGIGMTPGDQAIPEPYFYVTPWPYPEPRVGPALPHGRWHTEGWFGAVLTRSGWDGERSSLQEFLTAAVAAGRAVLPQ